MCPVWHQEGRDFYVLPQYQYCASRSTFYQLEDSESEVCPTSVCATPAVCRGQGPSWDEQMEPWGDMPRVERAHHHSLRVDWSSESRLRGPMADA